MFTKNTSKSVLTLAAVAMTTLAITANGAQASVVLVGSADFTLSSSTGPGATHDNLPAAFDSQIAPGTITPSTTFATLGSFPLSDVTNGNRGHTSGSEAWASNGGSSGTVTLSFASADVAGMAFNWAWGDRTDGDYEIVINGSTSLGTFRVSDGVANGFESDEPNTYVLFDTIQTGVTSIDINMSAGNGQWGSDEIEVYNGVAVPTPAAFPAGLALLGIAALRRRRMK